MDHDEEEATKVGGEQDEEWKGMQYDACVVIQMVEIREEVNEVVSKDDS